MKKTLITFTYCLGIVFAQAQSSGDLCVRQFCNFEPLLNVHLRLDADSVDFAPPYSFFEFSAAGPCWDLPDTAVSPNIILSPYKEDLPLNGVSTSDLVQISKHILKIEPFTEPWQWVAADANNDHLVTTFDIVEIRKLILGIYEELPNNAVWRFVRSDYVFPKDDPLSQPFPESVSVAEMLRSGPLTFLGIKIGDVSCEPAVVSVQTPFAFQQAGFPVAVFPNPALSSVNFSFENDAAEELKLQIHDLAGRLVYHVENTVQTGVKTIEVPAAAFPSEGLFIWTINIGAKTTSGKLFHHF